MGLVWIRENPTPAGGKVEWLRTPDGRKLRCATWVGETAHRGTVVALNGRTEFIEKYFEVIQELIDRGYAVATLDWRGQGQSDRLLPNHMKGHIRDFADYVDDLKLFIDRIVAPRCPEPFTFLGHSMGGAIGLLFLHDHGHAYPLERAVFTAPLLGIETDGVGEGRVRSMAAFMARVGLGHLFVPGARRQNPVVEPYEVNKVTQDRDRFARTKALIRADPALAVGAPTYGWVNAALGAIDRMREPEFAAGIRVPILIVAAGKEELVTNPPQEELAQRVRDGTFVMVEGAKHEILMETRALRGRFWELFDVFTDDAALADEPVRAAT